MAARDLDLEFSRNFTEKLAEARTTILSTQGMIRLISHYDPDGITSAAILTMALRRAGKEVHVTLTSKIDSRLLEDIRKEDFDLLIFSDMGSGFIETLEKFDRDVIVVDHHAPQKEGAKPVLHLNPHLFGFDGAREACGATMSFFLAVTIDKQNWELASLALAGAVGDRQNLGGFRGYNDDFVSKAIARELIKDERTLALKKKTIFESLLKDPEPYFRSLSGNKSSISKFLDELGIDEEMTLKDLDDKKKKQLTSLLTLHMVRQGASPEAIDLLVTERYWLYDRGMYVDELVPLLNACSRQKKFSLGLALALGSKEAMEEASEVHEEHISWIMDTMLNLEDEPPEQLEHIQFIHVRESTYPGVISGLGALYLFDRAKPIIGVYNGDDKAHISARATRDLVNRGLDLGTACREASKGVGGTGGGHNIASGAKVPSGKLDEFLSSVDRIVAEQLGA